MVSLRSALCFFLSGIFVCPSGWARFLVPGLYSETAKGLGCRKRVLVLCHKKDD